VLAYTTSGNVKLFTCIKCAHNLKKKTEDKQGQVKRVILKIEALWVNVFGSNSFQIKVYSFLHIIAALFSWLTLSMPHPKLLEFENVHQSKPI